MPDRSTSFDSTATLLRVRVLLPLPLSSAYDYLVPDEFDVAPGVFVQVPLGTRTVPGVVWDPGADDAGGEAVDHQRLKSILHRYDSPPMTTELRRLIDWVAAYTLAPPGAVLRMAMRPRDALVSEEDRTAFILPPQPPDETIRLTAARKNVLAVLEDGLPLGGTALARLAGCSLGVIRGMVSAGLLADTKIPARLPRAVPDCHRPPPLLSPAQEAAARSIESAVRARSFETFLLDGVTGSGKTEVYFHSIAAALQEGRQVLVLLPEIALTSQWHARFETQFGCRAAGWHSDLTPIERRRTWRDVADGSARVVVGARSALFLPFQELGLIVVDEEHDASFKQEDGVIYHARDMAVVRASLAGIPIVLASATPSLESMLNSERGRYRRVVLEARHGGATLPEIKLIDLRADKPARQRFLAPSLIDALRRTIDEGEQAMLFLNRRGYAPLTLCRACGYRLQCPNCTAWLVEHRLLGRLICHHCGHSARAPQHCPACDTEHSFAPCGPGVERVAEEVAELLPQARLALMASDNLIGPRAIANLVEEVHAHRIDILVGTQIMAKGHHFPMLTLVGVVDADLGLSGGDLRAAERTYQMLHQVSGRAGRAERPGTVLLQTFDPEHPVMQALARGDRDRFMALEADSRRAQNWPPYGRLAALIVSGPDQERADLAATAVNRAAPHIRGVTILGPAPAPLAVLRGRYRRRFLVKAQRDVNLQAVLRQWLGSVRLSSAIQVQIDIDPYSFL